MLIRPDRIRHKPASLMFDQTYSDEALLGIRRDLRRNPASARPTSWEAKRLKEIEREVKRRKLDASKEVAE